MGKENITLTEIVEYFYIREGILYWKVDKKKGFKDTPVGGLDAYGYLVVKLNGKNHRIHRLMYQIYNEIEVLETLQKIEHLDGNKLNNVSENLVLREDNKNILTESRSSNYRGVSWRKTPGIWRATIMHGGEVVELGTFRNETDAAEAYDIAQLVKDPECNTLNFQNKLAKYQLSIIENGNPLEKADRKPAKVQSDEKYISYVSNTGGYGRWRVQFTKDGVIHRQFFPHTEPGLVDAIKWRNETYLSLYGQSFKA